MPASTPVVSAIVVSAVALVIHHVRVVGPVVFLLVPAPCLPIKLSGQSIRFIGTGLSMVPPEIGHTGAQHSDRNSPGL